MRTALIILAGAYLAGCTSTHDLSKGPGVLGGGVQHIEVKPGLYSITAQTNWAPWSNYSAARRAWRKAADALCGKGEYQEFAISQAAKDTGMPIICEPLRISSRSGVVTPFATTRRSLPRTLRL